MISKKQVFLQFLIAIIIFSSCTTYKNIPYFTDVSDTSKPILAGTVPFKSPVIQVDDILSVNIQTLDQNLTSFLNSGSITPAISTSSTGYTNSPTAQVVTGYLVDKNGEIELPFAGKIKVLGLTTSEARDLIEKEVSKSFNNPVINVRFANFKITVLGEVARPSYYVVPNEKINIFDALGMAGDLTIYGRRENVMLIRDSLNGKQLIRLNLNSKDIVSSPYFYLKSNDIIYVEPSKAKIAATDAVRNRNIAILGTALSLLVVISSRLIPRN